MYCGSFKHMRRPDPNRRLPVMDGKHSCCGMRTSTLMGGHIAGSLARNCRGSNVCGC